MRTSLNLLFAIALGFAGCSWRSSPADLDDQVQLDMEPVLECTLQVEQNPGGIFHKGGIFATLALKNPTDHRERLIDNGLLGGGQIDGPPFIITKEGKYVPYTGIMVSKLQDDWYVFQPGESVTRKIRLNDYYDLSAPGEYQIVWGYFAIKSNTVKFVVAE